MLGRRRWCTWAGAGAFLTGLKTQARVRIRGGGQYTLASGQMHASFLEPDAQPGRWVAKSVAASPPEG